MLSFCQICARLELSDANLDHDSPTEKKRIAYHGPVSASTEFSVDNAKDFFGRISNLP